ncbi:MAG: 16S rRNA (guanine(527)-N(7))-methyltransferase RsmG [Rubrivivax sp.]
MPPESVARLSAPDSALQAGAAALGCPLTPVQLQGLREYSALLKRWGRVHNLTAVRDAQRIDVLHLLDSLAIVPTLSRHVSTAGLSSPHLLDVGSGGGLPGVVVAIARPSWPVTCIDAVAKKVAFVRQVALELGLQNLSAEHRRVGGGEGRASAQVVVSRAFAALADFCVWTRDELAPRGVWCAMKGRVPDDEVAALPEDVEMFHVERLTVPGLDAERCAVWLRPRREPDRAAPAPA